MQDGDDLNSVPRSIRIPNRLASNLKREASERRISVNALITSLLEAHGEWGERAEKFGFILLSRESFQELLAVVGKEELSRVARDAGRSVSREVIEFWFKEVNTSNVVRYLRLMSEYQRLFTMEHTQLDGRTVVVLHHSLGEKASVWFLNFVSEMLRANLGVAISASHTKSAVRLEIPSSDLDDAGSLLGDEIWTAPLKR